MGLLGSFGTKNPNDLIRATEWDTNFAAIVTWANNSALIKDVASQTVTQTVTWSASQTFSAGWTAAAACSISTGGFTVTAGGVTITAGGLTVTAGGLTVVAGTSAVQALTATTGVFSSTLGVSGAATFVTVTASSIIKSLAGAVDVRFYADSGLGQGVLGTFSAHDFALVTNSINRLVITSAGAFTLTGTLTVSSTLTTQAGLVVAGTATISGAINGQTISSAAALTGSLTIATTLGVTGATTLAALTCTTFAPSGVVTFVAGTIFQSDIDLTTTGVDMQVSDGFRIQNAAGSASYFQVNTGTSITLGNTSVNVQLGSVSLNSATTGYPLMPAVAGTPTGNPGTTGAFRYDSTAHKLWIYDAGWKSVTFA